MRERERDTHYLLLLLLFTTQTLFQGESFFFGSHPSLFEFPLALYKASQIKAREPNMQIFVKTVSMRASSSSLFASHRVV